MEVERLEATGDPEVCEGARNACAEAVVGDRAFEYYEKQMNDRKNRIAP